MKRENSSNGTSFKRLKPKNDKYHQGVLDPRKCKKYYSDCINEAIIYRSGLELDFINYLEKAPGIARWASEPVKIKYYSRLDKKECNYYPDFIIENKEGQRTIVEVKPYDQTVKPTEQSNVWLKEQWIKNIDKWKAAKQFAILNNMRFMIVTEKFFTGQ